MERGAAAHLGTPLHLYLSLETDVLDPAFAQLRGSEIARMADRRGSVRAFCALVIQAAEQAFGNRRAAQGYSAPH